MLAALWLPLAILFETPLAAAAVAGGAVSIPIIIHLLNRRRYRVVTWAAMRFLLAAQKKNSRRMRIEQLILLIVRCLILLLLVLAMAAVTGWAEWLWHRLFSPAMASVVGGGQRAHKVLVLDGSFSMGLKADKGAVFDRAKARAAEFVRNSPGGDAFSVILMADPAVYVVREASEDKTRVAEEIEKLRLPHGNSDLVGALKKVGDRLKDSPPRYGSKEVYFFTDLQRTTWEAKSPTPVAEEGKKDKDSEVARPPPGADALQQLGRDAQAVVLVDVGVDAREPTPNLAVTGLRVFKDEPATTAAETVIVATLHNYGKPLDRVSLKLSVGRAREKAGDKELDLHEVQTQELERVSGDQTEISFKYTFRKPGDYVVQVHATEDDLPLDDSRYMVVSVKDRVNVLLVNGRTDGDPLKTQSAGWLKAALGYDDDDPSSPRLKVIDTAQFNDSVQGDLSPYDCVFLCDVPEVFPEAARRLTDLVRRGGGVVFCLGPQINRARYNEVLFDDGAGLLPGPLMGSAEASGGYEFQLDWDRSLSGPMSRPPLEAFKGTNDAVTLQNSRFLQFHQLLGYQFPERLKDRKAILDRPILSFAPVLIDGRVKGALDVAPQGGPALVAWSPPVGAALVKLRDDRRRQADPDAVPPDRSKVSRGESLPGRVVVLTTSPNAAWHNWPRSPSYPAMMLELLNFAAASRLHARSGEVGQMLELFLPDKLEGAQAVVAMPDGRTGTVNAHALEQSTVVHWIDVGVSGVYKVTVGGAPREYLFAVNVPSLNKYSLASESDLGRTSVEELNRHYQAGLQQVSDPKDRRVVAPAGSSLQVEMPLGGGVAHILLLLVLLLVLSEVVLAWLFGHYSSVPPPPDPAGPKRPGAWEIAALATPWLLFAFLVGVGLVLLHNALTGDFLSFLPDGFRRWAEGQMGVPPPEAGEGTHWQLEYNPFFLDAASDVWLAPALILGAAVLIFFIYQAEGRGVGLGQRLLMGGVRVGLLLLLLGVLLPQPKIYFQRQGWPEVVLLIDDSGSMGALDRYSDSRVRDAADKLGEEAPRLAAAKKEAAQEKERLAEQRQRQADDREKEAAQAVAGNDKGREELLRAEAKSLRSEADALRRDAEGLRREADDLARGDKKSADMQRLHLAQALTTRDDLRWLTTLLSQRKFRLHIYRCAAGVQRVADITRPEEIPAAARALQGLRAAPEHDSSQLGASVRQVLNDFRGTPLTAIVMFTDGVTTEGEDIKAVARYAQTSETPLFFVGIGDAHEIRDLYLHDLQVEDNVFVNDNLMFELFLTAKGYKDLSIPVVLREKGKDGKPGKELDKTTVHIDEKGKPVKVQLKHTPKEAGEITFEIEAKVPQELVRADKLDPDKFRLERTVKVHDSRLIRVLYVEGYRRYEYWYIKTLLERETRRVKGNKSIDLKVLLLDADDDYAVQEENALANFPSHNQLLDPKNGFDVVILGDVDPRKRDDKKLGKDWQKDLAEFVRIKGGGLLMIAGERYSPQAYRDTPLAQVLPVELPANQPIDEGDRERPDGFRPELTPEGRQHPIFRFSPDDAENERIWSKLKPLYWYAEGYEAKPGAEVLAVHPKVKAQGPSKGKHPLVLQQFVGNGRVMFFGLNETWRWGYREDQVHFNRFWVETARYLSRNRSTGFELRLDRQTPYKRGEPIKVTVRYPDDAAPAPEKATVKVKVGPRNLELANKGQPTKELTLPKVANSRGTFEAVETQLPEGSYTFELSELKDDPAQKLPSVRPKATCKVVAPPDEMSGLRLNQPDLETAAETSGGKFYNLADADKVLEDLPNGSRNNRNTPGPPAILWNHWAFFLLALLFLTTEWLLRKRKNLL